MNAIRFAVRRFVRERAFSALAVGTLALGVGVVTASFAVVDAVLLQPIVAHQDRVVRIWKSDVTRDILRYPLSYPEFKALRDRSRSFDGLAAMQYMDTTAMAWSVDDRPAVVEVAPVSPEFLPLVTGSAPMLGRWLTADDDQQKGAIAAVVSARYWRTAAASDPTFIGRRLHLHDGRAVLVVGVAPDEMDYPIGTDVWVPIGSFFRGATNPGFSHFELIGRLAPGISIEQTQAELDPLDRAVVATFPEPKVMNVVATPLLDDIVVRGRLALLFLLAGAGLVLAVAGVNVTALLLMRGAGRRREHAVRLALGSSRRRLLAETATDRVVLGLAAALGGVGLAYALLALLRWLDPGGLPRLENAAIDVRVLAVAAVAVLAWVMTLGTAPAWAHRRLDPARLGDLSSRTPSRTFGLGAFTVAQISLSLVITIAAGLLLQSFMRLQSIDRGFQPEDLALLPLMVPIERYKDAPARVSLFRDLLARIEALPGVVSATTTHFGPGTGSGGLSGTYQFEEQTAEEAKANPWGSFDSITPTYFRTLGIPMKEGRDFSDADTREAAPVAIVSESIARHYWPGQSAVGKRVKFAEESPWATIVGVAGEVRYRELTRTWMSVYFPAEQFFFYLPQAIIVRTVSPTAAMAPAVRAAILEREPGTAIQAMTTMPRLLAMEVGRERATFAVMLLFAAVTGALAVVGVYGVLSYEVSQRRHELAVRSALGASPTRLFGSVIRRAVGLGGAGTAIGLTIAFLGMRSLESLLFEVSPTDSRAFAAAAVLLLGAACLAAVAPAIRAGRSAPAMVLRGD